MSTWATQHRRLVSGQTRGAAADLSRAALGLISVGYGLAVHVRNRLYDRGLLPVYRPPVPVVSVGNLTLGGTGKTPMVEFLARRLIQDGHRVTILSRGYGSGGQEINDEALVLRENLDGVPHLQGPNRAALAREACRRFAASVLVLDDGFQHRRLARDLDIVLVDCLEPFGFGRLFPRGLLREPLGSLARADLLAATRADLVSPAAVKALREAVEAAVGPKAWIQCAHEPVDLVRSDSGTESLAWLRGRRVAAFAGIGHPEAFWMTLERLGCRTVGRRPFGDHHSYTARDVAMLDRWADELEAEALATTQKDLVKLRRTTIGPRPLWAVRIRLRVLAGADVLDQKLAGLRQAGLGPAAGEG